MSATYLYGIIPIANNNEINFSAPPQNGLMSPIYTIIQDDFAAIVSDSYLTNYRGLSKEEIFEHFMMHQGVVETVMQDYPILPVKFGTFLPDKITAQRLLTQKAPLFHSALANLAGQIQTEIVVLWDVHQIFREIVQELEIEKRQQELADLPLSQMEQAQMAIAELVKSALAGRRAVIQEMVLSALRPIAVDLVLNPILNDSGIVNVALLLDQIGVEALDMSLEELDAKFDGKFTFRQIGPLPPHSFATVDIQTFSFATIEAARQRLGLAETATLADIQHAYDHLTGHIQPNRNPEHPPATAAMVELSQAYQLLTTYAQTQISETGRCRFDRQTVEQTILVSIGRQAQFVP